MSSFFLNINLFCNIVNFKNKKKIYSATGPLNRDYDDVRRISDAARNGLESAIKLGSKSPLLINTVKNTFQYADKVSLLSSLDTSYLVILII